MIDTIWLAWTNIYGDGFFAALFAMITLGVIGYTFIQFWLE
jgi:hypothetical protein